MTGNAMLTMNRKEFLRTGLSTMAAAGLPASAAAAATFGAPEGQGGPLTVAKLDPVIRLYPAKAASRSGALRFGPAELSVMLPFLGAGELLWTVEVAEPGAFDLALWVRRSTRLHSSH